MQSHRSQVMLVAALALVVLACSTVTGLIGSDAPAAEEQATAAQPEADSSPAQDGDDSEPADGAVSVQTAELVLAGPRLFLVDLDDPSASPIAAPPDGILYFNRPSWSPDGRYIALLGQGQGEQGNLHASLFLFEVETGDLRRLSDRDDPTIRSFAWSPDGSELAVSAARPGEGFELFRLGVDDGELQSLTQQGGEDPAWSPAGEHIAISAFRAEDYQLYLLPPTDPGSQQQITSGPGRAFQPAWSPSGERLAFASDRDGRWDNYDIYTVAADGSDRQRLTESEWHEILPVWSPVGDQIAFLRQRIDGRAAYDMVVMNADGSNQVDLTGDALEDGQVQTEVAPRWSPDGRRLAMLGFNDVLYLLAADGSSVEAVELPDGVVGHPAWKPAE